MTTHVDDVMTGVGLLVDGAVVPGAEGTYPVTNPPRPAEGVLQAPATWAALGMEERVTVRRPGQGSWGVPA